jgi:hypothetical protein
MNRPAGLLPGKLSLLSLFLREPTAVLTTSSDPNEVLEPRT